MYRISKLAKIAKVTPNTIRYYKKQQIIKHKVRTKSKFRLYTKSNLQQLKFIRHAKQLSFSLKSIRKLLSIRINPKHHTCQKSKGIVQKKLQKVKAQIAKLQSMQRSLQRLNNACCKTAHSSVYCSILKALKQKASSVKSSC